jgi:hypothetical protein
MIEVSTKRWEEAHNGKPRGEHYWRFRGDWLTVETDGPFPQARDRALERFRTRFGRQADLVVELVP